MVDLRRLRIAEHLRRRPPLSDAELQKRFDRWKVRTLRPAENDFYGHYELANAHLRLGNWGKALRSYRIVMRHGNLRFMPEANVGFVQALARAGKPREAASHLAAVLRRPDISFSDAQLKASLGAVAHQGPFSQVASSVTNAIASARDVYVRRRLDPLMLRTLALDFDTQVGNYGPAAHRLAIALRRNPAFSSEKLMHLRLASLLANAGKERAAARVLSNAVGLTFSGGETLSREDVASALEAVARGKTKFTRSKGWS